MFTRRHAHPRPTNRLAMLVPPLMRREHRSDFENLVRARCTSAYLGDKTALCRVLGRYKMYVDTDDVGLSAHLMLDGYWEMWLTEVLAEIVRPGMVVADVGANLGYFTLLLADLVGSRGRVHAFEPNRRIADRLRKSAQVNGFDRIIELRDSPLGDVEGQLFHLVVPSDDPKNAVLVKAAPGTAVDGADMVHTRRLDSFPELFDVDVVKIDADTAERSIWRGMRGIFDHGRPMTIILEFTTDRYGAPEDFLTEIAAEGFSLARIDAADGVVEWSRDQALRYPPGEDQMLLLRR